MKRSRSGLPTAQLLGCAVAFLGLLGASPPTAAPDPPGAVAACVRAGAQRPTPNSVGDCLRQSGYDATAPGGGQAVTCIVERYPGGDLAGCLDSLTPASAGSAQATAAPAASAVPPAQAVAQAAGPAQGVPNGATLANPPAVPPTDPPTAAAPTPPPAEPPAVFTQARTEELPWWPLAVAFILGALMAGAITYFAIGTGREPAAGAGAVPLEERGTLPLGVRIAAPNDFSVHAAGSPITLSANVLPPARADALVWTIVSPENRTLATGTGAQFAFSAAFTGVYHVVAKLDQTADDLLLLVYKTPSGGTRLTDLLQADPPPFPREPTSFVWNRSRTL